jgi:hypothetical protein
MGEVEDDKLDTSTLGRCLGLTPAGDVTRSPVSLSLSFSLSFARSRLILFLKKPILSLSCPPTLLNELGDRPNDPKTDERGGDVESGEIDTDCDNGVDSELPSEVDHRASSEVVNRLIAEIDEDVLTSPPRLLITCVCGRFVDGELGGGDEIGMGENVQCED